MRVRDGDRVINSTKRAVELVLYVDSTIYQIYRRPPVVLTAHTIVLIVLCVVSVYAADARSVCDS